MSDPSAPPATGPSPQAPPVAQRRRLQAAPRPDGPGRSRPSASPPRSRSASASASRRSSAFTSSSRSCSPSLFRLNRLDTVLGSFVGNPWTLPPFFARRLPPRAAALLGYRRPAFRRSSGSASCTTTSGSRSADRASGPAWRRSSSARRSSPRGRVVTYLLARGFLSSTTAGTRASRPAPRAARAASTRDPSSRASRPPDRSRGPSARRPRALRERLTASSSFSFSIAGLWRGASRRVSRPARRLLAMASAASQSA